MSWAGRLWATTRATLTPSSRAWRTIGAHATAATAWPGPMCAPPPVRRGERANRTAFATDRPMEVIDAEDVVDVLVTCWSLRDGEYGFHACAGHAESGQLKGISAPLA